MTIAVYRFGDFTLDCQTYELLRKGRRLRLERKPLELLILLVAEHGQIVTRDTIAHSLWTPEVFVDVEHGINTAIRKIRQALGDSPEQPAFVQTISGSGYRFIAAVTEVEQVVALPPNPPDPAEVDVEQTQVAATPNTAHPPEVVAAPAVAATSSARKPFWSARKVFWMVAAVCALAAVCIAGLSFERRPLAARLFHRASHAGIGSIAVLPLRNLSGDPGQEYFAAGMTDELTTELARIPNLRVVSRESVKANTNAGRPFLDIARQLDVDAIVDGSIVRSGDRIRITAQLIDARTNRHLWAQSFEGSGTDVLALQDNVAEQIAAQTSFVLTPPSPRAPINPAAYDAYLRGRFFFHKQDFARSLASFKRAVALDAGYASAQAGYASALDGATTFGIGTPQELMPEAISAAKKAIELDPHNGEAYTALGSVQTIYSWDWATAEQNLTRGITLNPSDSIGEFKYAVYLDAVGRTQDAVTHMRRALQLDPLSYLMTLRLGVALYYDRQYDSALAELRRAAEMEQGSASALWYSSLALEQKGDRDAAVQYDAKAFSIREPRLDDAALVHEYQKRGWQPYWRAHAHALLLHPTVPCMAYQIGIDDIRARELDDAFATLQRAVDAHCFSVAFIRVDPLFDSVRQDPRYAALLKSMHQ